MRFLQDTAHAKINLFLHVTGRRADGYHMLDSLAVFADAGDRISLYPSDTLSLSITGQFAPGLTPDEDNLVMRAARLLLDAAKPESPAPKGGQIVLEKALPVASGIGGGSSDAACTLRLLARSWAIEPDRLAPLAASLGADVPVCLEQRPSRMQGIGDVLSPVPSLPDIGILLVNPGVSVSTPEVFRLFSRSGAISDRSPPVMPERWENDDHLFAFLRETENDLQAPAIRQAPVIQTALDVLSEQNSCVLSRMSGSGATCFGLFRSPREARTAQETLTRDPRTANWWIWAGGLHPTDEG